MPPIFQRDPVYKAHYLHSKTLPPRWVTSKAENDYLLRSRKWTASYQHQEWPKTYYHKDFSIDVERAPDVEEFFNEKTGQVDERALQQAKAKRDKQRQRAIRFVNSLEDIAKLNAKIKGAWVPYHELPAEKARLEQEAKDNEADMALYGGLSDEFDDMVEEPVTVMGEPLRRGRRGVSI